MTLLLQLHFDLASTVLAAEVVGHVEHQMYVGKRSAGVLGALLVYDKPV